jgi:ADP-dependent NAD(P)H-hydrate dehydratase / NAD(P)H-hydrate epimerase
MKLFDATTIRKIDAYTIEHTPIQSLDLMERAARSIFEYIIRHYNKDKRIVIFAGQGNNGGDALAVARLLHIAGFDITIYTVFLNQRIAPDCEKNYKALLNKNIPIYQLNSDLYIPEIPKDSLIIDGILGTGLNKPVAGILANIIEYINASRCEVISIDIPSGLPSDGVSNTPLIAVKAAITISFQFPKIAFFFAENAEYIGKWIITDIGLNQECIDKTDTNYYANTKELAQSLLKKRSKFAHKGSFGHCLFLNGSYGKMGAAILSAKAGLRSGAGLITAYIPICGYTSMQISVPEVMCITDVHDTILTNIPDNINDFNAIACGCGIGTERETQAMIRLLLKQVSQSLVLDADALNCIAGNNWLHLIPKNTIITPHPKEFERLVGKCQHSGERLQKAIQLSSELNCIIVLKGAHTAIVFPDGKVYFNTTGNPGMATAGSGDVLTGMITGLLAQKYTPQEAALLGVYLHGLAGDCAKENLSEESIIATDIINNISEAYINTYK